MLSSLLSNWNDGSGLHSELLKLSDEIAYMHDENAHISRPRIGWNVKSTVGNAGNQVNSYGVLTYL